MGLRGECKHPYYSTMINTSSLSPHRLLAERSKYVFETQNFSNRDSIMMIQVATGDIFDAMATFTQNYTARSDFLMARSTQNWTPSLPLSYISTVQRHAFPLANYCFYSINFFR